MISLPLQELQVYGVDTCWSCDSKTFIVLRTKNYWVGSTWWKCCKLTVLDDGTIKVGAFLVVALYISQPMIRTPWFSKGPGRWNTALSISFKARVNKALPYFVCFEYIMICIIIIVNLLSVCKDKGSPERRVQLALGVCRRCSRFMFIRIHRDEWGHWRWICWDDRLEIRKGCYMLLILKSSCEVQFACMLQYQETLQNRWSFLSMRYCAKNRFGTVTGHLNLKHLKYTGQKMNRYITKIGLMPWSAVFHGCSD